MRVLVDWLRTLRLKNGLNELNDLKGWRSYTLELMLLLALIALPVGFIATFPHFISQGNYGVVVFDVIIFFLLLATYFNYDPFPQGVSFFAILYLMVIFSITVSGPFYGRPGWLVLCVVNASLLFGVRGAVVTTLTSFFLLGGMYWIIGPQLPAWAPVYADPASKWIMFMVNICLISLGAGLPVSMLLDRLDMSFTHERDLRSRLLKEGEALKTTNASLQEEIRERTRIEAELRASEESLRRITENMLDLLCEIDAEGGFGYISPSFERVLGYRPEDLRGQSVFTHVHPDDQAHVMAEYEKGVVSRSIREVEYRYRHADGRYIWLRSTGNPLFDADGNFTRAVVTGRDITDQKKAEDDLRKSEERYRIIAENARDVIWIFDLSFGYVYVSPAVKRLRGFTVEEALQQKLEDILTPESYQVATKLFVEALSREMKGERHGPDWSITNELEMVRKDGSTVWTEVTLNLLYHEDGSVKGIMGITRDISERRKAEEEKKALEHQLMQSQKMESMGTLAGGIAHDFNNILSAIIGYAELSKLHVPEGSQAHTYVGQVLNAGVRAKALVQQILSFSRHSMQEMKPVKVSAELKEAIHLLRATIPSTIEIRMDIEDECFVLSDPVKVHQIIMNLCTNAFHAMESDGGVLEVKLCHAHVAGRAQSHSLDLNPGEYLRITVSDTGQGMPPEVMDRIFEPYFTTKDRSRGTGLGLAVIHSIVKNHRGSIRCFSTPGKGTTFDVYLPELKVVELPAAPAVDKPVATGTERVLFVDDEETVGDVGKMMLESLGYRVTALTSPLEALDLFRKDPEAFDLVMTDMTMPGMTGDLLAGKLMEIRTGIPVILCTGYSERITAEKAHAMGIREFVMKPLELKALSQILRDVIEAG